MLTKCSTSPTSPPLPEKVTLISYTLVDQRTGYCSYLCSSHRSYSGRIFRR
ncbi:unnamed protein product [Tenebrio molitor]|nr:unnamed protein product [Tenebrio molitor]